MTFESHRSAATLYASGDLTADGVLHAIAQLEGLPSDVRAVCLDLRGVRHVEERALRALETALRDWRASRCGISRVELPEHVNRGMVAMRYTHRRQAHASAIYAADD